MDPLLVGNATGPKIENPFPFGIKTELPCDETTLIFSIYGSLTFSVPGLS